MIVKFTVPGEPVGKGRPRATSAGGHARMFTPAKTVEYENLIKMAWSAEGAAPFPEGSMLRVRIIAYMTVPKSAGKRKRADMQAGRLRPTRKPDIDNIVKIVCDGLNKVAWHDDSAVVEVAASKWYCVSDDMMPCVAVEIAEVEE